MGDRLFLGGAFGLLHYLDYRPTHDVDAWWVSSVTAQELDSFPDLVASKMVALVERGAPRDFRDIHNLCQAGLSDPPPCWQWWKERQRLAGSDVDIHRARLAVETHLARIVQHRPLPEIPDGEQSTAAASLRAWFTAEFLDALVD